jgi:hypothetical protein
METTKTTTTTIDSIFEMDFSYCRSYLVYLLISSIVRGGCSSIKTASTRVFLSAAMVVHRSLPHGERRRLSNHRSIALPITYKLNLFECFELRYLDRGSNPTMDYLITLFGQV